MRRLGRKNDDYERFFFVTQHDDRDDYDINVNVMITMILCGSMSRKQGMM